MTDNLTPKQRSYTMSRIRSVNTNAELLLRSALHRRGYRFRLHASALPGKPDIVFPSKRVAVFIDGDFWHGWKFAQWREKLAPYWKDKIEGNRRRDGRTRRTLRRAGWTLVRLWEHEVEQDLDDCVARIAALLGPARRPASI
jgi:DNA mismatch endonuclease (patch repair protein)